MLRTIVYRARAMSTVKEKFWNHIKRPELLQANAFIDGDWISASSDDDFPVTNPATNEVLAKVASMSNVETESAVQAAKRAQVAWAKTTPHARSTLIKKWFVAIMENAEDLALICSKECGKPLEESRKEVDYAAGFIEFFAHECMRSEGFVIPSRISGQQLLAVKEPVGVCAIITPWNFPLAMITRKVGPCLAAGCTAVIKPAAETPLSALALAWLAQDVGFPAGVLNVLPTPHENAASVGETLATHSDVRKLSFTGSTRIGKLLMQQSSANVKRLSLELGGNAAFIVFEDANLDSAIDGLIQSKFRNTGQTCVCSNRFFVHESIYTKFVQKLIARVRDLKMGDPINLNVQLGPLISSSAFSKTKSLVDDARAKGAKILIGGAPAQEFGENYFQATVLEGITNDMRIAKEEIFGPVVPLQKFETDEQVLHMANCTEFGLAGYFYSGNYKRIWHVARALECGMIGVNTGLISYVQAPFGGVKESGFGREGSFMGLEEYLETKYICMAGLEC